MITELKNEINARLFLVFFYSIIIIIYFQYEEENFIQIISEIINTHLNDNLNLETNYNINRLTIKNNANHVLLLNETEESLEELFFNQNNKISKTLKQIQLHFYLFCFFIFITIQYYLFVKPSLTIKEKSKKKKKNNFFNNNFTFNNIIYYRN